MHQVDQSLLLPAGGPPRPAVVVPGFARVPAAAATSALLVDIVLRVVPVVVFARAATRLAIVAAPEQPRQKSGLRRLFRKASLRACGASLGRAARALPRCLCLPDRGRRTADAGRAAAALPVRVGRSWTPQRSGNTTTSAMRTSDGQSRRNAVSLPTGGRGSAIRCRHRP